MHPVDNLNELSLKKAVTALAKAFNNGVLTSIELAELRRMDPESTPPPAFWHAIFRFVVPYHTEPKAGSSRFRWERQWQTIMAGMAAVIHVPNLSPGRVLAEIGFHELRLRYLLRASEERFSREMNRAVHLLAAKGAAVNWHEMARLTFFDPRYTPDKADMVRRRIARDYFGTALSGLRS